MLNRPSTLNAGALIAGLIAVTASAGQAQFNEPPPAAAYALRGVTLVRPDGTRQANVTLIVRGHLIERLGSDTTVPPDAQILTGDSLVVYPGLIDAHGKVDFKFPEPEVDRATLASWAPPRHVQGFQPERRVVDALTATGAKLKAERAKGVVAAGVQPTGPLMPGRGAVVLFRPRAREARDLVVQPSLPPLLSFERPRGVYPSTVFAVTAFIRQAFEDARREAAIAEAQRRDPAGMPAPTWDPAYQVLHEAMTSGSVFFAADDAEDIRNALTLSSEYGLRPIIVGGKQAWRVADELRAREVPVLVSLDFSKPKRWKPEKPAAQPDTVAPQEPQELDAAAQREKQEIEAEYRNAARLAEAGVTIALTSGGGAADLRQGARKAIEYGLTEEQALAALTTTPAALLGVPYIVRVEPSMPATFVVTDGPLFGEKTNIVYTFVEGVMERGRSRAEAGTGPAAVTVTGTWDVVIEAGGERIAGTMTLAQEGASFSGTMTLEMGTVQIADGSVSGNRITFSLVMTMGGQQMTMEASGTVEGDRASGSGDGPMGSFRWTATKSSTPGGFDR